MGNSEVSLFVYNDTCFFSDGDSASERPLPNVHRDQRPRQWRHMWRIPTSRQDCDSAAQRQRGHAQTTEQLRGIRLFIAAHPLLGWVVIFTVLFIYFFVFYPTLLACLFKQMFCRKSSKTALSFWLKFQCFALGMRRGLTELLLYVGFSRWSCFCVSCWTDVIVARNRFASCDCEKYSVLQGAHVENSQWQPSRLTMWFVAGPVEQLFVVKTNSWETPLNIHVFFFSGTTIPEPMLPRQLGRINCDFSLLVLMIFVHFDRCE